MHANGGEAGETWRRVDDGLSIPFSEVSWDGPLIVGLGSSGLIATSTDGKSWITRFQSTAYDLRGVAWSGSHYVAVGYSGVVLRSPDGIEWQKIEMADALSYGGITWSGTQFLVFGNGALETSFDGITWNRQALILTFPPSAIAHFDGATFLLNRDGIFRSEDLVTWDQVLSDPSPSAIRKIDGRLFCVGGSGLVASSSDGITWTRGAIAGDPPPRPDLQDIAGNGSRFVATGNSSHVLYSEDGQTWTVETPAATGGSFIRWINDEYLVVLENRRFQSSTDGKTWTQGDFNPSISNYSAIAHNGNAYVAIASDGAIWHSTDGSNWEPVASTSGSDLSAVTGHPGGWVAVGSAGTIISSADGRQWTARDSGTDLDLNGVAWNGERFACIGDDGTILASPDGESWAPCQITSSTEITLTRDIMSIVAVGSGFNASGQYGTSFNSLDGILWEAIQPDSMTDVVWNGTSYVGLGFDGAFSWAYVSSADALEWTRHPTGASSYLVSILWTGELLVACGSNGTIVTSPDGVTWTPRETGTTNWIESVTSNGDQIVAVGLDGTFLVSEDGINWSPGVLEEPGTGVFHDVVWTGDRYVAVGLNVAATSTDGINWQYINAKNYRNYTVEQIGDRIFTGGNLGSAREICYLSGTNWISQPLSGARGAAYDFDWNGTDFLAATSSGIFKLTEDTSRFPHRWQAEQLHVATSLVDNLTRNGDEYVALGRTGTIILSRDGVSWKNVLGGRHTHFKAIASSGNGFAGIEENRLITSRSGNDWNIISSPTFRNETLRDVIWAGDRFILLTSHYLYQSSDGEAWSRVSDNGIPPGAISVTGSGELLLTVGGGGLIARSESSIDAPGGYDQWISAQGVEGDLAMPLEDANRDGISNLIAYMFGIPATGSMTQAERSALPAVSFHPTNGSPILSFDLRESYRPGATYHVEVSSDLQTGTWQILQQYSAGWDEGADQADVAESPLAGGGIRVTIFNFPELELDETCFFRLRTILP